MVGAHKTGNPWDPLADFHPSSERYPGLAKETLWLLPCHSHWL